MYGQGMFRQTFLKNWNIWIEDGVAAMKKFLKDTLLPCVIGLAIGGFLTVGSVIAIRNAIDRRIEAVATVCECVCCVEVNE
jgi:esterase/lipase